MRQRSTVWMACGVLALATAASAQWRPFGGGRPYPGGRGGAGIVDRALSDLDRARSYGYTDHHERKHFDQARKDLIRFQENWARGRFDKDRLDGAIENLNHLANADQVNPRDRRIFYRDVEELRAFRARAGGYGGWGYRRGP